MSIALTYGRLSWFFLFPSFVSIFYLIAPNQFLKGPLDPKEYAVRPAAIVTRIARTGYRSDVTPITRKPPATCSGIAAVGRSKPSDE